MTVEEKKASTKKEIALFLLDTQIPSLTEFGDFADQGIKLLSNSKTTINSKQQQEHQSEVDDNDFHYKKYDIITKQDFPSEEQLKNSIRGIYLTGSRSDSFDDSKEWIGNLINFLKICIFDHPEIKIVGICFGHQVIARALDLTTKRNELGWEMGVTPININPNLPEHVLKSKDLFGRFINDGDDDETTPSFNIVEMHQDIVELDEQSRLRLDQLECYNIGSTSVCELQGIFKESQLLTFQGHPEFDLSCTGILVDARLNNKMINEDFHSEIKSRNSKLANEGDALGEIIHNFLKN